MKKKIIAAVAVLVAFSLSSCGSDETEESSVTLDLPVVTEEATEATEADEPEETTEETTKKTTAETSATTTAEKTTEKAEETTKSPKATDSEEEQEETTEERIQETTEERQEQPTEVQTAEPPLVVPPEQHDVSFSLDNLGNDISGVVSSLGEPLEEQSVQGCLTNGADQKIYTYDGVKLYCYVLDGVEYAYMIEISANYPTSSGIYVGSSKEDVEAAYGAGEESGNYIIYREGEKEIDFQYDGNTVSSITFYMPA